MAFFLPTTTTGPRLPLFHAAGRVRKERWGIICAGESAIFGPRRAAKKSNLYSHARKGRALITQAWPCLPAWRAETSLSHVVRRFNRRGERTLSDSRRTSLRGWVKGAQACMCVCAFSVKQRGQPASLAGSAGLPGARQADMQDARWEESKRASVVTDGLVQRGRNPPLLCLPFCSVLSLYRLVLHITEINQSYPRDALIVPSKPPSRALTSLNLPLPRYPTFLRGARASIARQGKLPFSPSPENLLEICLAYWAWRGPLAVSGNAIDRSTARDAQLGVVEQVARVRLCGGWWWAERRH